MSKINENLSNGWKESRRGAWAGRGFHYQHLFSALILVRQCVGLAPVGPLVPEGLEDCVLELADHSIWIQIKSLKNGTFSNAKVEKLLVEVNSKVASIGSQRETQIAIAIEQPRLGKTEDGIDQLFDCKTRKVIWCSTPGDEIVRLLTSHLGTAEVIADGIASDLYRLVAEASEANASLSYERRRRISTTEVERRIFERLEAEDPSAIDNALASGVLEPVDFNTPVDEPSFYQGVKVRPGHVAAKLVLNRLDEMNKVISTLKNKRHVLISGPSGAGKSALMWLSANALAGDMRWFQIVAKAAVVDADVIIRFIRARRPNESSPIALVFDEVGSSNSDLWNVLVRELRDLPSVYFLGSVRREDVYLIANQSDTEFVAVNLDEKLALSVWEKLSIEKQTTWPHWREPFEQSEGLMLEYVHLLTQGKRLASVIEGQVRQREREERYDELAIVRSTAVLCARGGEVEAQKLFKQLELEPNRAGRALKRLVDEHLVSESRPGILGGLHTLRSEALSDSSHDEIVFLRTDSLWRSLLATTNETLPKVIQSILTGTQEETQTDMLRKLAETLEASDDINVWVSVLTGLGLATMERHVISFMAILEQHEVQHAQWFLASMFVDPGIKVPELQEFEQWQNMRNAVIAFRALPKRDLRPIFLELLLERCKAPACNNLRQASQLFSCLVPIAGGEPVQVSLVPDIANEGELDIREVAAFLSTAYLIGPDIAKNFVDTLGGEQVLFKWFGSQTPWVTVPVIEANGVHGRTIHADCFYVDEQSQSDFHETICQICEILIAISPNSDAAASSAVDPFGQPITTEGHAFLSKNMPRQNIPPKARIAWNVAFRQILLARAAAGSLTDYTQQMSQLVTRTEKIFRSFTEKWIRGKRIANVDAMIDEINDIIRAVNALAYAAPKTPSHSMVAPDGNQGTDDDTLGALLTGVLGNLVKRLSRIPGNEGAKGAAVFAGSLAAEALEHKKSDIWRTVSSPPLGKLVALAERLEEVACILHEMAHDESGAGVLGIVKAAKNGALGKAVRAAARRCNTLADQRFSKRLRILENDLKEQGWNAHCWTRPIAENDSVHWPANEVAILFEIENFEKNVGYIEDGLLLGQQHLGNDWRFRIVPVLNGQVIAPLAILPSSHTPQPDLDFKKDWKNYIGRPFLLVETTEKFDAALTACNLLSTIMNCRDLENLHPEENNAFSKAIETFKNNRELVAFVADKTGSEHFTWALDYLDQIWNQVASEFESVKNGYTVNEPLCMSIYYALAGQDNEQVAELGIIRILMLQDECSYMTENSINPKL